MKLLDSDLGCALCATLANPGPLLQAQARAKGDIEALG